jgi:hypothetical protein
LEGGAAVGGLPFVGVLDHARTEFEQRHRFEGVQVTFLVGPDFGVVPGLAGVQAVPDGFDDARAGVPVCLGAGVAADEATELVVGGEAVVDGLRVMGGGEPVQDPLLQVNRPGESGDGVPRVRRSGVVGLVRPR